ncbi:MAG TPA: transporter [Verrucomicrobiae bacterium]|nr:transporter [Verrucomicrobiae bacterium]
MKTRLKKLAVVFGLSALFAVPVFAQTDSPSGGESSGDEMSDIAQKLNNPVASLISVPIQNNFDFGGGPNDNGFQYKVNVQPVIPFALSENWNLITRTIMPYIYQHDRIGDTSQSGLGDTTESLFFAPAKPGPGGLIWGIGPDLYLPTATETALGAGKWGAGPTGLLLWQKQGWTYGALVNHIWSFAGSDGRQDISSTFLQPFLSYTTAKHTTFTINSESAYDWENRQWTVPLNAMVTQLLKFGKTPVSFQLGARYYAAKPDGGPDWGLRFSVTFVFPKG